METKKEETYEKGVMLLAIQDMVQELAPEINPFEIWTYRPTNLINKTTTRLNRQLGIHKINKAWEMQRGKFKNRLK
jgi:hypothetical protein